MSPLEQLHADQHDDIALASDHALAAYLAEAAIDTVLADREPTTDIERRHLNRVRRTT